MICQNLEKQDIKDYFEAIKYYSELKSETPFSSSLCVEELVVIHDMTSERILILRFMKIVIMGIKNKLLMNLLTLFARRMAIIYQ